MLSKCVAWSCLRSLPAKHGQTNFSSVGNARRVSAIPLVDISPWVTCRDDKDMLRSATELGRAFESTGFAIVVGHGVPSRTINNMSQMLRVFFDGPRAIKEAIQAKPIHGAQGWHPQGHENVAQLLGDFRRPPDLVERITFSNLHRTGGVSINSWGYAGEQEEVKYPAIPGFREATHAYVEAVTKFWERLIRMSESALGIPSRHMDEFYGDARSTSLQLVRYLRSREDSHPVVEEDGIAFGAHTDSGGFTILYTDGPGLEVELADGWHAVPIVEGAYVVNVGRLLSRWTNDRWLASVHRVRNVVSQSQKLSIAHFTSPRGDAIIEPLPTCVESGLRPKYNPVKVSDFLYQRHLLHIPPEQRKPEEREIPKEFWEAPRAVSRV